MKIEISENIILKTKCRRNSNQCLSEHSDNCCKVIDCVNGEIHFIQTLDNCFCHNMRMFGGSSYCICPVRKEIFNKFGL